MVYGVLCSSFARSLAQSLTVTFVEHFAKGESFVFLSKILEEEMKANSSLKELVELIKCGTNDTNRIQ